MTIQQIEYALILSQHNSYSRAAKAIGISQPGLSLQIKKLEEQLGIVLFDRSKRVIEVTPRGKVFLDRAQLLLNEFNQLVHTAKHLENDFKEDLNIGIIPTLAPYLIPLFINDYNKKNTHITLNVQEALTEEILEGVKEGTLDAGIISTPISSVMKYNINPLFYEGFKLFVSPEHSLFDKEVISSKELNLKDIWSLKEGNCFRNQVDQICTYNRKKEAKEFFHFESASIESLCRIVEFKGGITFIPELTTLHFVNEREDMIKDLKENNQVREISLISIPNHIKTQSLFQLGEIIKANLPVRMLSKKGKKPLPVDV